MASLLSTEGGGAVRAGDDGVTRDARGVLLLRAQVLALPGQDRQQGARQLPTLFSFTASFTNLNFNARSCDYWFDFLLWYLSGTGRFIESLKQ